MKRIWVPAALFFFLASSAALAQEEISGPVYVSPPVVPTLTKALRDLPDAVENPSALGLEMKRREDYGFIPVEYNHPPKVDPLVEVQRRAAAKARSEAFSALIHNFAGQSSLQSPPDTTGDVGPNYFVQATNQTVSVAAFVNKSTGAYTTKTLQSLATSSPCNSGFCDPVVLYDRVADRWILSELPSSTGDVCVYVSTSGDPLGTYYAYAFAIESSTDYPKYGVWPQNGTAGSYLVGVNASSTNGYWDLFAFDRAKMLAGQAATFQKFQVPRLANAGFQLVLPSHMEGSIPPPNGEPAIFARPHDDENADSPAGNTPSYDWIDLWALSVDWTTPASSTFTKLPNVNIADYDMTLCGMGNTWNCMPQPGTTQKIDPIREPLHFPLHYRNLGDHQALVGTFVEDVDGTDHAGLRWFELRKPESGGSWSLYQEGLIGGEANVHRSVGSISMDGMGNLAIGYTRTGTSSPYFPSIKYSGRQITDPLGTMPNYDLTIVDGLYSKTANERWGDYSGMATDPSDDCTFWFTTEYMLDASNTCGTRVAAFNFNACTTLSRMSTTFTDSCASGGAGNGNGIIDPGESISLDVTLRNGLSGTLAGVTGTLTTSTPGITIVNASTTYSDLAPRVVAANNAPHFSFSVAPSVAFGTTIALNLHVTALSGGGPFDIPLTFTVGSYVGGNDATQVTTPLSATSGSASSSFAPAFTLAAATTGTLTYTPSYTGLTPTLFGPDDMAAYATNWTASGTVTTQSAAHCSPTSSYTRLSGNPARLTLKTAVSTVGFTNIHVHYDYAESTTTGSTFVVGWSTNGTTWTDTTLVNTATWQCGQDLALPAGAEGQATLYIHFQWNNTNTSRSGYLDTVSITGLAAPTGTWTANARVSLVDPASTATVLKAYGVADANPYNIQPYFTGAGTYQIRIEENAGNVATVTGAGMHAAQYAGNVCASAAAPPPRVPYSVSPMKMTTANHGTDGTVTWDVSNCASTGYHILYGKGENLPTWTVDGGKCAIGTSGTFGWTGVPDPSAYASRFLWWLVAGDDGGTKEGSWGLTYPAGAEEGGASASNQCSCTTKDTSASCGTP